MNRRRGIWASAAGLLVIVTGVLCDSVLAQNPFLQNRGQRTITAITFQGHRVTRDYILEREFGLKVGDDYDPVLVSDGWTRLEQLSFIAYVDVQEDRPSRDEIELTVFVEEDDRLTIVPFADYERRHDGYILGIDVQFTNFRGRNETLSFSTNWLERHGYQVGWQNPHILGPAALGVFATAQWARYDFEFIPTRFRDEGFTLGAWRDYRRFRAQARYDFRHVESNSHLPGEETVEGDDPAIEVALSFDSRDIRFYPTRGFYSRVSSRLAGLGQDEPYHVLDVDASGFVNIPFVDIIGAHVHHRMASERLPFYERSYLGGPDNLRGIDFGSLRGDERFLAVLEIRRPIFLMPLREGRALGLGVHAFHDWGKTWDHGSSQSDAPLRYSRGLGVHLNFNTKNLRIEWAHTDDGDNVFVFEDEFTF